jgi:hypothetical protein
MRIYALNTSALWTLVNDEAGADAWIAETPQELNATIIHKDPKFENLLGLK